MGERTRVLRVEARVAPASLSSTAISSATTYPIRARNTNVCEIDGSFSARAVLARSPLTHALLRMHIEGVAFVFDEQIL